MGKRKETNTVVVHCSATKPSQDVTFDTIKRWHLMERAFIDIGYHWVIERDGSVKQGRAVWMIGGLTPKVTIIRVWAFVWWVV